MRCDCCDKILTDKEATAKFFDEDPKAPARYVMMCTTCQRFLPTSVRIITRNDLPEEDHDDEWKQEEFNFGESNDDE